MPALPEHPGDGEPRVSILKGACAGGAPRCPLEVRRAWSETLDRGCPQHALTLRDQGQLPIRCLVTQLLLAPDSSQSKRFQCSDTVGPSSERALLRAPRGGNHRLPLGQTSSNEPGCSTTPAAPHCIRLNPWAASTVHLSPQTYTRLLSVPRKWKTLEIVHVMLLKGRRP